MQAIECNNGKRKKDPNWTKMSKAVNAFFAHPGFSAWEFVFCVLMLDTVYGHSSM